MPGDCFTKDDQSQDKLLEKTQTGAWVETGPTCPECGHEIRAGEWPWCPHGQVSGPPPIVMWKKL